MAAVLILSAFLVLRGIAADATGCIAIWWMSYYPIWSLTYIAASALVI